MSRIISMSLGNFRDWDESLDANRLIRHVRKLDINGVEINYGSEDLLNFKLSVTNKEWLRNLDFISIHSSNIAGNNKSEDEIIKNLDALNDLYEAVNAKNIIIHSTGLPCKKLLKNYKFKLSVENLRPKARVSINDLRKVFKEYPNIGLCLDVSHAYFYSKNETSRLIKMFKNRITQVHLSGTYRRKDHTLLMNNVTKEFLKSIKPIKKLSVPIVMEEAFRVKSLSIVRKEIKFVNKFLDSKQ